MADSKDLPSRTAKAKTADNTWSTLTSLHTGAERRAVVQKLYVPFESWETRVLVLHPGDFDDPLIVSLHTAVLTYDSHGLGLPSEHRVIEYEALSYTWGGEIFSHPILCNGHQIGVMQNLSTAFRYLRRSRDEQKNTVSVD